MSVIEVSVPETTDLCFTLGITDPQQPSPTLHVWPNPLAVGDMLRIDVKTPRAWQCTDALGRIVAIEAQRTDTGLAIPTAHLEPGHYMIRVSAEEFSAPAIARFVVY